MDLCKFCDNISIDLINGHVTKKNIYGKIYDLHYSDSENDIIIFNKKKIYIIFHLNKDLTEKIEFINNKLYFVLRDIVDIIKNYYESNITHMQYKELLNFIKNNKNVPFNYPLKIKKKYLFLEKEDRYFNGFIQINENTYKLKLGNINFI